MQLVKKNEVSEFFSEKFAPKDKGTSRSATLLRQLFAAIKGLSREFCNRL